MQEKAKFLITIDTEGDNLWALKPKLTVKNAIYLWRFQELCEKYNFKPTYLTNYEMANSPEFKKLGLDVIKKNTGEIGMHLHAWDMPPFNFSLTNDDTKHHSYLIEYPKSMMQEKIKIMTNTLQNNFGIKMLSHRAGRWAFNSTYAKILIKNGYKIDCSVTPHVNWCLNLGHPEKSGGSNYTKFKTTPYFINPDDISKKGNSDFLELPVTIYKAKPGLFLQNFFQGNNKISKFYKKAVNKIYPTMWLRPNKNNLNQLLWLVNKAVKNKYIYIEFMLHSSEFMPGGSFNFKTKQDIENLYKNLEVLFSEISKNFKGQTLTEFYNFFKSSHRV